MSDQQLDDEPIIVTHLLPTNDSWRGILPVTISQVLQAEPSPSSEDDFVIEGKSFAAVTLVAHVVKIEEKAATISYILEDGTGRICADKTTSSAEHFELFVSEAEKKEITQCQAFENTYVVAMGAVKKNSGWNPRIQINSIHPVHSYHQVMYHILNVIHTDMLFQCNQDSRSKDLRDMTTLNSQTCRLENEFTIQYQSHVTDVVSESHPILSNTFSPQKHQPYATLKSLERAIMKYMCHCRNHSVLCTELAQAIQESYGCTEFQFNLALQTLLSEAYITSPLDDGYVVVTPRH